MILDQFPSQIMTRSILSLHCVAPQSRGGFKKTMAFQPRVIKQRLGLLWSFVPSYRAPKRQGGEGSS